MTSFKKWLEDGLNSGYCTEVRCATHDTLVNDNELPDGEEYPDYDECIWAVRIYQADN